MIRNRYDQIPHPDPDTKQERNTNNLDCLKKQKKKKKKQYKQKVTRTTLSQQMASRLFYIYIKRIQIESRRTMTIIINHNRSTALEWSVINYWW